MTGTIITFFYTRGFGFIQAADNKQYFFHVNNFKDGHRATLGARVEFDFGEPFQLGKSKQAVNVRVIESPAATAAQALVDAAGGAK